MGANGKGLGWPEGDLTWRHRMLRVGGHGSGSVAALSGQLDALARREWWQRATFVP